MRGATVFGISNCDRVRKARAWLAANGIPHEFHDFRKQGLTRAMLERWIGEVGWEALVNRKSSTWRGLDTARKASVTDAPSALALMLEYPTVIQRPVVIADDSLTVGFDEIALRRRFVLSP